MIKEFIVFLMFLLFASTLIFTHYISFPFKDKEQDLIDLFTLTKHISLATSSDFTQTKEINIIYPDMPPINNMDFIYAK